MNAPVKKGNGAQARFSGVTKEWLEYQYIELDRTMREIGAEIGASQNAVKDWLDKYGLSKPKAWLGLRHSQRMSGDGNPAYTNGYSWRYQRNVLRGTFKPRRCIWCGAMDDLQVHHVDHNKHNGNAENLEWLCGPCNRMEAQLYALTRAGRATVVIEESKITITFQGIRR